MTDIRELPTAQQMRERIAELEETVEQIATAYWMLREMYSEQEKELEELLDERP